MKPDKFDIKIQEAAAQNESAYDEQAWDAMEKLLDEKMPQKKKDKRKIFWLFLLLFIGIAGALMIKRQMGNQEDAIVQVERNNSNTFDKTSDSILIKQKTAIAKNLSEHQIATPDLDLVKNIKKTAPSGKKIGSNYSQKKSTDKIVSDEMINTSRLNSMTESENSFHQKALLPDKSNNVAQGNDLKPAADAIQEDSLTTNGNSTADTKEKIHPTMAKNNHDTSLKKNIVPLHRNKFGRSLFFNLSIGQDISAVNLKDIGKVEPLYGAGIGYEINKSLTIRTGIYIERKVYDAKSSEYHPPVGFWNYYPNLKYIDADCKIYEVPIMINFNFNQTLKHLWFGSVGISSYFMKKESYNYFSKTPSGQDSYENYSIANKNRHYLSSVKLAAGYEKKLGNTISLIAEPYINFPLSGVGYGKVKLYSAGILFSLNVKPFSKK